MKLKSLCVVLASFFVLSIVPFSSYSTNAATVNVKLGDANNDGNVNMSDAICILQYLSGQYYVSAYCFTAMDINEDQVVDKTDVSIIQNTAIGNMPVTTINKELYTLPGYESRNYTKYICSTGNETEYPLSAPNLFNPTLAYEEPIETMSISPDNFDTENRNVVQLTSNGQFAGSGFVINEHVIATAAHCVYNIEQNSYVPNIKVNVYDSNSAAIPQNLIASFDAVEYHIPSRYKLLYNGITQDDYDYALIYVNSNSYGFDLLDYVSAWDMAISSLEFSKNTTNSITASGFTTHSNQSGYISRYYSTGTVVNFSNDGNNTPNLRIKSNALSIPGKSGGIMYHKSTFGGIEKKYAVAVITGGGNSVGSWGVRINPSLLRFYKQNPNINNPNV